MSLLSSFQCQYCRTKFSVDTILDTCPSCGGAVYAIYDYEEARGIRRDDIARRVPGLWKYFELLPIREKKVIVSLGEGGTHLHDCQRLAAQLGVRKLYIKDETTNPTGSFIDRGTTVAVSRALELRCKALRCGTTGNLGASVAAYAAKAGLSCKIYLAPRLDLGKLYQIIAYGADLEPVRSFDEAVTNANAQRDGSYVISPGNPYFLEGEKTTGYEIAEQLGWELPDRIIVPMGNGGHLSMIWKGLNEMVEIGFLDENKVMMTGIQAQSAAPIARAFASEAEEVRPIRTTHSIVPDLGIRNPIQGELALQAIRKSGGYALSVPDRDMFWASAYLARVEGIFAEPAAASTIAGLKVLVSSGQIDRSERIVCVITGAGLKDPSVAKKFAQRAKHMENLVRRIEKRRPATIGKTKINILRAILNHDAYGYEIWKQLRNRFGTRIDISSVYQHLLELETAGLIRRTKRDKGATGRERHYYAMTDRGRAILKSVS
jgi:threonine synthase